MSNLEHFKSLIENAIIGIYRTTPDGRILMANPTLVRMLGYSSFEELAQLDLEESGYAPGHSRSTFKQQLESEGQIMGFESAWARRDGTPLFVRENATVIRDEAGNILYYEGTVEDITDRVQAEEALRRRDTILEAVSFAGERFLKTTAWEKNIPRIMERLGQATQVSRLCIFENRTDDTQTEPVFASLRYEWLAPGVESVENSELRHLMCGAGGLKRWRNALSRGDTIAGNVKEFPAAEQKVLAAQGIKSIVTVPIFMGQNWWGCITLEDCSTEREWSEGEIEALKAATGLLDAVFQRRRAEQALQQRNRELELLNRAGQALASSLDLNQVLTTVLEEVRTVLRITACSVWLVDPETGELVCRQVTNPQAEIVLGWRLAPGQGVAGWVAETGKAANVPDTRIDDRHFKGVDEETGLPILSILSVPLRVKGEVIGVIQVVDQGVGRFDEIDARLVEALASAASAAIENAQLYEELKSSQEYARNIIDSSLDMIITVDTHRRIVEFNRAAQSTFGYHPDEVVGQHVDLLYANPQESLAIHEAAIRQGQCIRETFNQRKNGEVFSSLISASILHDSRGEVIGVMGVSRDITQQKKAEAEREQLILELQEAVAKIKTLRGLVPICSSCKKIRDDQGFWQQLEVYIQKHSDAEFSHGLCPDCAKKLYPDIFEDE